MDEDKYVRLKDVEEILRLIEMRDMFEDFTSSYKECDEQVKIAIKRLEDNTIIL